MVQRSVLKEDHDVAGSREFEAKLRISWLMSGILNAQPGFDLIH